MEITIYKDFCIHISSETPENKHIINMVLNLPDDLGIRILNEFSTRVLFQKIHPIQEDDIIMASTCLLYTSPSPRDATLSRMPSSA